MVDVERGVVLDLLEVGRQPDGLAVSKDGRQVFVANFGSDSLSVIDTREDRVVATIAVGGGPVGVAISPTGEVYVVNKKDSTLSIVDLETMSVIGSVALGQDGEPNDVAVTPDGSLAVVTKSAGDTVSIVDTAQRRVVQSFLAFKAPNRVAISADGKRAFVSRFLSGGILVIDLVELEIEAELNVFVDTLAASTDGQSVLAVRYRDVFRVDAESLELESYRMDELVRSFDLMDVPGTDTVVLADLENRLLIVDLPDTPSDQQVRPVRNLRSIPLAGGPFAIAILPEADDPALTAAIESPTFGQRVEPNRQIDVRITVGDASAELADWDLTIRPTDQSELARRLASGTEALADSPVATILAADLTAGRNYRIELVASSRDGSSARSRVEIRVPNRTYSLVPLDEVRVPSPREIPIVMDGVGSRFATGREGRLMLLDTSDGLWRDVTVRLENPSPLQLSRNGDRLLLGGPLPNRATIGVLNLESSLLTLVHYRPFPTDIDIDAEGRWLAAMRRHRPRERYRVIDTFAGEEIALSDVEHISDPAPPVCDDFDGNRPRISADGDLIAFVSSIDLGFEAADRCNVFTYRRSTDELRLLLSLPETTLDTPSMDDAGTTLSFLRNRNGSILIDLVDGSIEEPLAPFDVTIQDTVLTGDGSALIISSCLDLDPEVGNTDLNQELFHFDLAGGDFRQITDTTGGGRCEPRNPAYPLLPEASQAGDVVEFAPAALRLYEARRDVATGLAFGHVRAVRPAESNRPPALEVPTTLVTTPEADVSISITAADPDDDPIVFFAEIEGSAAFPDYASFGKREPNEAEFWWGPGRDLVGRHTLRVAAFDGRGGSDLQEIDLIVCARYFEATDLPAIIASLFDPNTRPCGDADANRDGLISAADVSATIQQGD